jgi:hypothetical protein
MMSTATEEEPSEILGELEIPDYRFHVLSARMYRFTNPAGRSGWGFEIMTDDAFEEPPEDHENWGIYPYPPQLTTEQEPIPLPDPVSEDGDFTGLDFVLKEPMSSHEDGGDYFLFTPIDSHPVSDVRIRFHERAGSRYRIELSGMWQEEYGDPRPFCYRCWIDAEE